MDLTENESEAKILQNGIQNIVIVRETNRNKTVLSVVDILLSVFVVTPLVVLTWRGLWGLMDVYSQYFPAMPSLFAGMIIHIILAVSQENLHRALVESNKTWSLKLVSHLIRRFYTYIFLTATVLHWRGGWELIDSLMNIQYTENLVAKREGSQWFLIIWATCFVTLVIIKCLRNAIAPPFAICIDKGGYVFRFPTMFRRQSEHNLYLFGLDCIFSVGIMGNLVVIFWRGLWFISDIILLPGDYVSSSWMSLIIGSLSVGLIFRLQNCIKNVCAKSSGFAKVAVADFYIVLSCISTILYWRGIWNLCYIYILPDNVRLSCTLTHLIGFTFLLILDCSNSLLVRGVYQDGKEPNGECIVFPCQYLRIIWEAEDSDGSNESTKESFSSKTIDQS